jgi:hypothetical protein
LTGLGGTETAVARANGPRLDAAKPELQLRQLRARQEVQHSQTHREPPGTFAPEHTMNCQILAKRIQVLEPKADTREVARTCLLLSNSVDSLDQLSSDRDLMEAWRELSLKLQLATDQHAAMTEELQQLASSNPEQFNKEQIWVLIRAIKVQSQVLQLYLGEPAPDI